MEKRMKEGVRLTFKGVPDEKRKRILKVLKTLGLSEIASQHDTMHNRHSHDMHINGDLEEELIIEEPFRVEAGIGC